MSHFQVILGLNLWLGCCGPISDKLWASSGFLGSWVRYKLAAPFRPVQRYATSGCDNEDVPTASRSTFIKVPFMKLTIIARATLIAAAFCVIASAHAQTAAPGNPVTTAAAKEDGAVVTPSGLVYRSLKDGTGASPAASDKVKVHYRGTFPDGKEFDSSYKRNEAIEFPLSGVIKCWTEGVQRMKVGGKAKLTCPPAIAYGERGAGGAIPPNATLLFEVELLAINGK